MKKHFTYVFLMTLLAASLASVRTVHAATPVVSVNPAVKNVLIGEQFAIDIVLDYAENLYGYEIWISYDHTKLNATAITYMGYLNEPTHTWYQLINNTGGYVTLAISSTHPAAGKTGGSPPPLMTINFTAIATGSSPLHLYNTILSDDQARAMAHATSDGTVNITGGVNHDVAVTNVTSLKRVLGKGFLNNITVTLENQGDFEETFNVTVRANTTDIETKEVTLASYATTSIIFKWNSTTFPYGAYTLSAYAQPLPGEIDIADNTFVDGEKLVSIPGDINGDGIVDIYDAILLAASFNAYPGHTSWNPDADINSDGIVDIYDAILLASHYNEELP